MPFANDTLSAISLSLLTILLLTIALSILCLSILCLSILFLSILARSTIYSNANAAKLLHLMHCHIFASSYFVIFWALISYRSGGSEICTIRRLPAARVQMMGSNLKSNRTNRTNRGQIELVDGLQSTRPHQTAMLLQHITAYYVPSHTLTAEAIVFERPLN